MRREIKKTKRRKQHLVISKETPDGLDYTSEAWRRTLPPDLQLLTFTCLHRVFTREQAVQYLNLGTELTPERARQASSLLDRRTGQQQWFCSISYEFSEVFGGTFEVYYLTQHAVVELRKMAPVLAVYAAPGRPSGVDHERVPHDVDVVEAHLRILRTCEVHQFLNENELKRQSSRVRNERRAHGENAPTGCTTGDFSVLFSNKNSDEILSRLCEVATENMKASQVKTKPDRMVWFTRNLHRRDVIAEIKGSKTPVIMLEDPVSRHLNLLKLLVNLPGSERQPTPEAHRPRATSIENLKLTPRERRVLHALEQFGGTATTEAVAAFLGVKRTGISTCLNRLARKNVLRSEGACLSAEHDLGTPTLLYMRWEHRLASENLRRHRLITSLIFVEFALQGFRFCSYDAATGALEMRHTTDATLSRQVILADNHEVDLATLHQKIVSAQGGIREYKELIVAMTDRARMQELHKMGARVKIVDVSRGARYEVTARDEAA